MSKIPRATIEGFAYNARPDGPLEIPLKDRIAAIRKDKAEQRARAKINAALKGEREAARTAGGSVGVRGRSGRSNQQAGRGNRREGGPTRRAS